MNAMAAASYDPRDFQGLTFHDVLPAFRDGTDSPRAYLERCLETIAVREPVVQAFAALNEAGARDAADASSARWKAGRPLSSIDGLPIGIKDLLETKDMPTQMGCEAYRGNFPKRDNAAVRVLRDAGAVVVGKTVTAELGGLHPGPTTNPFDPARTPGGSSSGSAAAVAARMLPACYGSQVVGSIVRPAAFCGNIALKPSQGAINRGERVATSQSTHGVHAGSLEDMWRVAMEIAARCGGDAGNPGLMGPMTAPIPVLPERLIVLETEGWAMAEDGAKAAYARLLTQLERAGVTLLRRSDNPLIETLEQRIAAATELSLALTAWENQWTMRALMAEKPEGLSVRAQGTLAKADGMTVNDYRAGLLHRELAQRAHAAVAGLADAAISLSCPGPAPLKPADGPGAPLAARPTGDPSFNTASSILFAPVVTLPLLGVVGMPVGVQLMGQPRGDATISALAGGLLERLTPEVA